MLNQQEFVASLIVSMQDVIAKHNLELMKTYPNDLLVHDRAFLIEMAVPGALIGWVVGDTHTHMVNLGVSQEENEMVYCLTRLSNRDRFYSIKIESGFKAAFKEYSRESFDTLASTKIDYSMSVRDFSDFSLLRHGNLIGHISVDTEGPYQDRVVVSHVIPHEGITARDKTALSHWSTVASNKIAGTLFGKRRVTWSEPLPNKQAA